MAAKDSKLQKFLEDNHADFLETPLEEDGVFSLELFETMRFTSENFPETVKALENCKKVALRKHLLKKFGDLSKEAVKKENEELKSERIEKAKQVQQVITELEPYLTKVDDFRKETVKEREALAAKIKKASHTLKLANVSLPTDLDVKNASRLLESTLQALSTEGPPVSQDISPEEFFSVNRLYAGILFTPEHVAWKGEPIIALRRDVEFLKNPPNDAVDIVKVNIECTSDSVTLNHLDKTLGDGWSSSAATKGVGIVYGGIGAWSASMAYAKVRSEKQISDRSASSQHACSIQKVIHQYKPQKSNVDLNSVTYGLHSSFVEQLKKLEEKIIANEKDTSAKDVLEYAAFLLGHYGSHFPEEIQYGMYYRYNGVCEMQNEEQADEAANALHEEMEKKASAGVGIFGTAVAGNVAGSYGDDSNVDETRKSTEKSKKSSLKAIVTVEMHPQVGSPSEWVSKAFYNSKSDWARLKVKEERIKPLWDLVTLKGNFENRGLVAEALEKAWVKNIMKSSKNTADQMADEIRELMDKAQKKSKQDRVAMIRKEEDERLKAAKAAEKRRKEEEERLKPLPSGTYGIQSQRFREYLFVGKNMYDTGKRHAFTWMAKGNDSTPKADSDMRWEIRNFGDYYGIKSIKRNEWLYVGEPMIDSDRRYALTYGKDGSPESDHDMRWEIKNFGNFYGIKSIKRNEWLFAGNMTFDPERRYAFTYGKKGDPLTDGDMPWIIKPY